MESKMPKFPEPFWRESINISSFPKLNEDLHVDVGIVGGGITGITAAYLLSKQDVKVALIDAGDILNGTTAHTTAKITAQHGIIYDEFIQHFGKEKAALYYQAALDAKSFIEDTIDTYEIDCDFKKEEAYIYTNEESYVSKLETEKAAYEQLNITHRFTKNIPLNIPIIQALTMKDQAQFHPLKFLEKLVDESVKNGVQIYENTTAVDAEFMKSPSIVTRNGHRIRCNYIIQASQFPFYDGEGFYPTRMYAERAYVMAVRTPVKFPGGMYINAETPTRSIRTTSIGDEELWIVAGENHKTGQGKSTIEHYEALQKFAKKQLKAKEFVYRWSAQDLTTLDKLPYIGPVTEKQKNVFVATGYRKWGMTNGTIAAQIISDLIIKDESPYAGLYSPSRFQADPSIRKFAQINADVAKHLIKGKLEYTKANIDELEPDDATITRIKGQRTGVYKDQDGEIFKVDTTCTHLGCEVAWNSGDRTWDCPCHGSRFSYKGEVITGPAKEPLKKIIE